MNVGGTATLIGDPPNILIGTYTDLTFGAFVSNLTLICIVCMLVTAVYFIYWYKQDYMQAEVTDVARTIAELGQYRITDRRLLILCLTLLSFTVFLFIIHGVLHMEPSVAALTGAMLLLAISRVDIVEMLEHEVEWPTLIFFMALFMVITGTGTDRPDSNHRRVGAGRSAGEFNLGHSHRLMGVGHCLGLYRQYPFYRHHAAHHRLSERHHTRGPERGFVVGPGLGGVSGGERHHDRGLGQRGDRGPGRAGRLSYLFSGLEGLLCAHADHHSAVFRVLIDIFQIISFFVKSAKIPLDKVTAWIIVKSMLQPKSIYVNGYGGPEYLGRIP